MKVLKFLIIAAIAILAGIFGYGYSLPKDVSITRSIVINAPSESIHPLVNSFQAWRNWAPWNTEKDPTLKYTYEGSEEGVGSKQIWKGKDGEGNMVITKSDPKTGIEYDITMMEKKEAGSIVYEKEGEGTKVTWTFNSTDMGAINRIFVNMFKGQLEGYFDEGLEDLKSYVETGEKKSDKEENAKVPEGEQK